MNYKLTIIFLFSSLAAFSQNPYVHKYSIVNSNKDTTDYTLTVTGSSSFFSSKVTQRATLTNKVRPYKPPVITAPPTQNLAPTVNLGADRTYNLGAGQTTANVALAPTVADESPSTITYQWTGAGLNSTTASSVVATAPVGTNTYTVKVTDNGGLTATDEVKVTVNPFVPVPPVDPPPTGELNPVPTWTPIISTSFENEPVTTGFNSYIQEPNKNCVTISSDFASKGTKSAKFYLSKAEADAGAQWRAEMTEIGVAGVDPIKEGDEFYYSGDYYLPTSYVPTNEEFITQWHHNSGSGSPPVALMTQNGNFIWDYITTNGGKDNYKTLQPYKTGKWTQILYHFVWSSNSSKAVTEIWIDGTKYSISGANLFSGMTNYAKLGIYKWVYKNSGNSTTSRTIYVDNWRIWKR